jgi:predicted acylesterase/phospholipase RssA
METNIANMNGKPEDNVRQSTVPRHIVVSGGGPSLFTIFGAVKCLVDKELIDPGVIKSIHACSSGAFIGIFLCVAKLGMSFEELELYIISRCWKTLFANEVLDFRTMFNAKGLFDSTILKKAISPLLLTVGLTPTTTLANLFDVTRIELVLYAVDINSKPLKKVKLSHKTYPDMKVYEALTITMGLPGVMTPTFIDEMCLVDGGLLANYPYVDCTEDRSDDEEGIIGFKIKWEKPKPPIDSSSNMFTFLAHLTKRMANHIDTSSRDLPDDHNTVECSASDSGNPSQWLDLFGDSEIRANYIEAGVQSAIDFIAKKTQQTRPESHT